MCCVYRCTYIDSPKKHPLVIYGDYSVFFLTVPTGGINHDISLSWSKLFQNISKRLLFETPFHIILYKWNLWKRSKKILNALQVSVFITDSHLLFLSPLSWLFCGIDPCSKSICTPWLQDWEFCFSFLNSFVYSRVGEQGKKKSLWRIFCNLIHF